MKVETFRMFEGDLFISNLLQETISESSKHLQYGNVRVYESYVIRYLKNDVLLSWYSF